MLSYTNNYSANLRKIHWLNVGESSYPFMWWTCFACACVLRIAWGASLQCKDVACKLLQPNVLGNCTDVASVTYICVTYCRLPAAGMMSTLMFGICVLVGQFAAKEKLWREVSALRHHAVTVKIYLPIKQTVSCRSSQCYNVLD